MSTFTASSGADTGPNSLSEAIYAADNSSGADTIIVSSPVTVTQTLTSITDDVTLSGSSLNLSGSSTFSVFGSGVIAVADTPITLASDPQVYVGTGATLTLNGIVSGSGALTVSRGGLLNLTGSNTYTGGTTINSSVVQVSDDANLGADSGTVTLNGGQLTATGSFTDDHPFAIVANSTISVGGGATLTLDGAISGSTYSLTKIGAGALVLDGASVSIGNLTVAGGTVTFGSASDVTFAGGVNGSGALTKDGAAILTLTGYSGLTGATTVSEGVLKVQGSLSSSAVTVDGDATLTGHGHVAAVTVEAHGILTPGDGAGTTLSTGDLTLQSGSTFDLTIASGSQTYADVAGAVNLDGATLSLHLQTGFTAAVGDTFTVIHNDGTDAVTGTFNGLAEGATVTAGGFNFQVSYVGGSGNGVTLTVEAPPAPSTPALESASDSGASNSDQITSNAQPTLSGTAEAHATVTLYDTDGTTVLGTATADANGDWSITAATLSEGDHTITATATDAVGNVSAASSGLTMTIDTTAPAAPAAAHLASGAGDHTDVVMPTFTGTVEAHATVTLYDTNGTTVLGSATADGNGDWSITSSTLSLGAHTVAATATDLAGNVSTEGAGLTVTIEAPPPPTTTGVVTVSHPGGDGVTGDAQNNLITSTSGGADTIAAGDGADTVIGGPGGDVLQGNAGQDSIAAGDGDDAVRGGQGDDRLQGNTGHDLLFGDNGADTLHGGQGDDLVQGNAGNDLLFGDNGADTLHGGQGDDQLSGGAGDDYLSGDLGANTLTGGEGADVFDLRGGAGHDTITDFSHAQGDHIWLSTSQATDFEALLGHISMAGGDAVITLPGETVVLVGVSMSSLTASDFVFG